MIKYNINTVVFSFLLSSLVSFIFPKCIVVSLGGKPKMFYKGRNKREKTLRFITMAAISIGIAVFEAMVSTELWHEQN